MKRLVCLLPFALCLCILTGHAQQGINSGTINTRVGCTEALRCTGRGTRISWRKFRVRVDLVNTTNYYILTESTPVEGDATGQLFDWESTLVFPSLAAVDSNLYTCYVIDMTRNMASELVSVQMNVDSEPADIAIPVSNKDISSYYVGDPISMGCSVDTCATGITMQFLLNDLILAEARPSPTDERPYTMSLPAQLNSAGTYTCRVTTDSPSYLIQQSFNVIGTPMIRPISSGGSSIPPSGPPASEENGASHLLPSPLISLLLVMAALCCVIRS